MPAGILPAQVEAAKKLGVNKIIINHPEWWLVNMPIEDQKRLAPYGVYFERCYATRWPGKAYERNFAKNFQAIEAIGCESTIIATDGGHQMENSMWSDALSRYIGYMVKAGLPQAAMDKMTKSSPATLLGLDPI